MKSLPCILQVVKINLIYIILQISRRLISLFSLTYILDKLVKQDVDMLTEIIPHKPQKRWFAREYFSTSWTSCSTSVSLGRLPVHNDRHVFKHMKMTIIHHFQRTFYLGSSCCITYQNLGERFLLIFSVYKVCIYSYIASNMEN